MNKANRIYIDKFRGNNLKELLILLKIANTGIRLLKL